MGIWRLKGQCGLFIGLQVPCSPEAARAEEWGIRVESVDPLPGQPGLAEGDFIVAIEGKGLFFVFERLLTLFVSHSSGLGKRKPINRMKVPGSTIAVGPRPFCGPLRFFVWLQFLMSPTLSIKPPHKTGPSWSLCHVWIKQNGSYLSEAMSLFKIGHDFVC